MPFFFFLNIWENAVFPSKVTTNLGRETPSQFKYFHILESNMILSTMEETKVYKEDLAHVSSSEKMVWYETAWMVPGPLSPSAKTLASFILC